MARALKRALWTAELKLHLYRRIKYIYLLFLMTLAAFTLWFVCILLYGKHVDNINAQGDAASSWKGLPVYQHRIRTASQVVGDVDDLLLADGGELEAGDVNPATTAQASTVRAPPSPTAAQDAAAGGGDKVKRKTLLQEWQQTQRNLSEPPETLLEEWMSLITSTTTVSPDAAGAAAADAAKRNHSLATILQEFELQVNRTEDEDKDAISPHAVHPYQPAMDPNGPRDSFRHLGGLVPKLGRRNTNVQQKKAVVPNIVHFIWFNSDNKFSLLNAMSVVSANMFIRPRTIHFHTDKAPTGEWWDFVVNNVSSSVLHVNVILKPQTVWGIPIKRGEHSADVERLHILIGSGGIYLDNDVIVLKSFDQLRAYDCVLTVERWGQKIANGIIIARKGAPFLRLWLQAYRTFNPDAWVDHSVVMGWRLYEIFPHLVHLEHGTLVGPSWDRVELAFRGHWNWSGSYSVHIWKRFGYPPCNLDELKAMDNMVGEVMRYVYYGTAELLAPADESLIRLYKGINPIKDLQVPPGCA